MAFTEDTAKKFLETVKPNAIEFDSKPFKSLMRNDAELKRTYEAIESAIFRSIATDIQREPFSHIAQRGITKDEIKYRFKICEAWFRHARGDLGYSLEKTIDLMGHALRCELDGQVFDPEALATKRIWTPT